MLSPAAPGDAPAFRALLQAAFADYARGMGRAGPYDYPWLPGRIDAGEVLWWGATAGAVVRAADDVFKLDMLAVHPEAQGQGLGARVLAGLEAHARALGARVVTLHTAQRFTRLVAFYARAGYRVQAVGPHPQGTDDMLRVFMVKTLD